MLRLTVGFDFYSRVPPAAIQTNTLDFGSTQTNRQRKFNDEIKVQQVYMMRFACETQMFDLDQRVPEPNGSHMVQLDKLKIRIRAGLLDARG